MIAIIDYDMGNLRSVSKAFEEVGASVSVTRDPKVIRDADKIVLPGVGAFPKCMENLHQYGLIDVIREEVGRGKWFLGICLGMQLLFEEGDEFGPTQGLSLLKGQVPQFPFEPKGDLKIPQMGWNQIEKVGDPVLFKDIPDQSFFYFVHSFYVKPAEESIIATRTDYGMKYCSSIQKDNILATQFHPEKSQKNGLKILENFSRLK